MLEYRNTYQALLSVENVIMFLFAAILTLTFDNHHLFGDIDFVFIYILSISLLNGTKQSILSVVLASSLYIYRHLSEGASAYGGKSLNLGVNQKMNSKLLQGELFLGDYWNGEPSMAMPVLNKGHLAAVIILNKIPFEKQTLYYSNLFRTVVALISIAILRAYDFERITRGQNYIDGTEILKPKAFMELLNIKDEASSAKLSEYTLVHIKKDRLSAKEIYEVVGSKLRETDYLGLDTSGELYVLLSNTSRDEASVAINRLEDLGVEAKVSGDLICQVS